MRRPHGKLRTLGCSLYPTPTPRRPSPSHLGPLPSSLPACRPFPAPVAPCGCGGQISRALPESPGTHHRGPSESQLTLPLGFLGNVVHSPERRAWALNAHGQEGYGGPASRWVSRGEHTPGCCPAVQTSLTATVLGRRVHLWVQPEADECRSWEAGFVSFSPRGSPSFWHTA